MKFKYLKFPFFQRNELFGPSILRPVIPMRVAHGDISIQYDALVDSGADFCIFDAEVAENLGIDISRGIEAQFAGVQGSSGSKAYIHQVVLEIGGWKYKAPVAFSRDLNKRSYGILGQKGFFELFSVKFDYSKEEIELMPKKK